MHFLKSQPGLVAYGELYGAVGTLKYWSGPPKLAMFDLYRPGSGFWAPAETARALDLEGVPTPPLIAMVNYDFGAIAPLTDGPSLVNPTVVREGVVVSPLWPVGTGHERYKLVSVDYLALKRK